MVMLTISFASHCSLLSRFALFLILFSERLVLPTCRQATLPPWSFFEVYGWRLLIGAISAAHSIHRFSLEHCRRTYLSCAPAPKELEAAERSRKATLDAHRTTPIRCTNQQHHKTIDQKRGKGHQRLRWSAEFERRMGGDGHRLDVSQEE